MQTAEDADSIQAILPEAPGPCGHKAVCKCTIFSLFGQIFHVQNDYWYIENVKALKNLSFLGKYFVRIKKSTTFALAKQKGHALLAQLVEQLTLNQWVQGSNP